MMPATMQPTDSVGKFLRDQAHPVVLAQAFPACMHDPVRSAKAGNQTTHLGGIYDDECLQGTPIHWNYGHASSRTEGYLDRSGAGHFGNAHRITAHDELDDLNAPVIDSGYSVRTHDRIRRKPGLFERVVARLKFWPDRNPYVVPEFLRHQKD
jgi:hypothetical protein